MHLVLLIAALILFILATIPVPARFNLVAAGLACYIGTLLIGAI